MKTKLLLSCVICALLLTFGGCYMSAPQPLLLNLKGNWQWVKTTNTKTGLVNVATTANAQSLKTVTFPNDSRYFEALEFYRNEVKFDSLFVLATDNYRSSITDEKNKQVFVSYLDGKNVPAVVRVKFFFEKGKSFSRRMEINVQKNTSKYNAAADTLVMEFQGLGW